MLQKEELLGKLNEGQKDAVNEIYSSTIKLEKINRRHFNNTEIRFREIGF